MIGAPRFEPRTFLRPRQTKESYLIGPYFILRTRPFFIGRLSEDWISKYGGDNVAALPIWTSAFPELSSNRLISTSFGPSTVRVNTETVYSGRREADLAMTSTEQGPPDSAQAPLSETVVSSS
jgi:hypothetical protein